MKTRIFATGRIGVVTAGVIAAGFFVGGCASRGDLDSATDTIRSLTDRNEALKQQLSQCQGEVAILRGQYDQNSGVVGNMSQENARLQSELSEARQDLLAFEQRLANARLSDLDPVTAQALESLAAQYPNLIQYDADRGMLRFSSDLTFDKGSVKVKDAAMPSLKALANILKGGSASGYDIHIVGHTDAQPLSWKTREKHPTNMYLSCHRAIAVRDALAKLGVPVSKMQAAGWGEFRPLVPQNAKGPTPANRRVEIFLTASTGGGGGGGGGGGMMEPTGGQIAPDRAAPPDQQPEPVK